MKKLVTVKEKVNKEKATKQSSFDDSGIASEVSFNNTEETIQPPMPTKALGSSSPVLSSQELRKHVMRDLPRTKGSIKKRLRPQNVPRSNVERRRRVRCHVSYSQLDVHDLWTVYFWSSTNFNCRFVKIKVIFLFGFAIDLSRVRNRL